MPESKIITIGMTVGMLTVSARIKGHWRTAYLCVCACGNERTIDACNLRRAIQKKHLSSCGCYKGSPNLSHGHASNGKVTRTYRSWQSMLVRCTSKNGNRADAYVNRGISVCERWKVFQNFLDDMGERPAGLSLERINNDGSYEPLNCRWATPADQARNRRRNVMVEYQGNRICALDFSRTIGIRYQTFLYRLRAGWTMEEIIITPVRQSAGSGNASGHPAQVRECAR